MKKIKIIFLAAHQWQIDQLWEPKAKQLVANYNFEVEVLLHNELSDAQLKQRLKACDGLITTWGSPCCSAAFLAEYAPNAKVIGHAAGSVNSITDESTYNTGIEVISANPVMAQGVAEWSLLATLLAARNFGTYTAWYGKSKMNFPEAYNMSDIQNMTIGLWGMGDTTKHLLKMLAPLNPQRILVASNHSTAEQIAQAGAEKVEFNDLIVQADIFHALVGINHHNFERFGENEFKMLKEGATFINCGRAHLTKESALLQTLQAKRINAILDVFHVEPLPEDSPLYQLDNVILTPHNAGYPGRDRFIPFLFEEFRKIFNGIKIQSKITKNRFLTMTNEKLKHSA